MKRASQYRFLGAGSAAVAWIAFAVYAGLARPTLTAPVAMPLTWIRALGRALAPVLGRMVGGVTSIVLVWLLVTLVLFALLELVARLRRR